MLIEGTFAKVLVYLIEYAVPILFIYWLLERPFVTRWLDKVKVFVQENFAVSISAVKRYTAILLSIVISVGLYVVLAKLGYEEVPVGFEAWADLVFTIGAINFTGTQIVQSKDIAFK